MSVVVEIFWKLWNWWFRLRVDASPQRGRPLGTPHRGAQDRF